jgi:toxin ParE1/3/4
VNYRLIIREQAEADIAEAALWYQEQRAGLGDEFLLDIQDAIGRAAAHPCQYPRLRHKPEVRRILAARFPYRIFFIRRPDAVVIFRVLHGARHDREWKMRLPQD